MKKFVVTELKILDEEKYKNLSKGEKPELGDIFDEPDYIKNGWFGTDDDIANIRLEDQTDDKWNKLEREYTVVYENEKVKDEIEHFSSPFDLQKRIDEIYDNSLYAKIYYSWKIIEEGYENVFYPKCWLEKWKK